MSIDRFKQIVIESIKEMPLLEAYDLTEGTNAYDLIILPMTEILYNVLGTEILDSYINRYDMSNVDDMEISDLIRIGALHAVQYREEAQTTGHVVLCFLNDAVNFTISEGSTLTYQDIDFIIHDELHITSAMLTGPGVDGLYRTHPIYVYNTQGSSVAANVLGQLDGAPTTLVKIEHGAMTNGVPALNKEIFRQQIVNSLHTRQLVGYASISNLMRDVAPSVRRIKIVGAGDKDMVRDTILDINNMMGYNDSESGFVGKLSGLITSNTNQAFKMFTNDPIDNDTPGPASLMLQNVTDELTDTEYSRIADETNTILISSDLIVEEEFEYATAEQEVELEDIDADDSILTIKEGEVIPEGMVDNRLLLITGKEPGTDTLIWFYSLIKAVNIDDGIITLYKGIPNDVEEAKATLDTRDGYELAGGWFKAEDGAVISPELGYDFAVDPKSSSIAYFMSEEVGVLNLGTAMPIFSELQAMVNLLQAGGEVNLKQALVKGLYPLPFGVIYPRRGQRISITGQIHVNDIFLGVEFSYDAKYNTIEAYAKYIINYTENTMIHFTGITSPPPNPFTEAYEAGRINNLEIQGKYVPPGAKIIHAHPRNSQGYRLALTAYPDQDDIQHAMESFTYPATPNIYRLRVDCRVILGEIITYPAEQSIKTTLMWGQTYASHYTLELRETSIDGAANWNIDPADYEGRIEVRDGIKNPYADFNNLTMGKRYFWRVKAISDGGETDWLYSHFRIVPSGETPAFETVIVDPTAPQVD